MIKIGVIGTHGTRKTSLCYNLAGRLKSMGVSGAGVMGEIARILPPFPGFRINEGTNRESQQWIVYTQIKEELEFLARGDVNPLITDRTVFDNYMYYLLRFGKDNPAIDALVNNWTKTYNLLVKMSILKNNSLVEDPVRAKDEEFKLAIDNLLERELEEREIPFERYSTEESLIEKIKLFFPDKK